MIGNMMSILSIGLTNKKKPPFWEAFFMCISATRLLNPAEEVEVNSKNACGNCEVRGVNNCL
jgi:hypothetical protein